MKSIVEKIRVKGYSLHKKLLTFVIIHCLFCSVAAPEETWQDTLEIYNQLCGNYEFYSGERYSPIIIYLYYDILMGKEKGCDPIILKPVNLSSLEFTAYNGQEYFRVNFGRNEDEEITEFVIAGDNWKGLANRINHKLTLDQFSPAELREDFNQFRKKLEEEHCCLYEYTSKETFDSLFIHQYALINKSLGLSDFFKILTPITAMIGCGHTAVWMPDYFWDQGSDLLFPLRIRLIENLVVVADTYADTLQLPFGSIIRKINDVPVTDIIAEMKSNYSADAFNENFILTQIERRFPLIYARRFGFFTQYKVEYQLPAESIIRTAYLNPAELSAVREQVFANFNHPRLEFDLLPERNIAIMRIKTFIYYDRVPYFTAFLDSCFQVVKEKNIENLILDLRGNDGGDPFCAAPLLSYLEREPVPYFAQPYAKYKELADPVPLADNHFTGNLFTLIDGRCFSTNGHFCALLKYHQLGKFIGTNSGSTYKCNAGKNTEIHLKNTRIMLYFGRDTFAAAVKNLDKREPIHPDYPVVENYQQFLTGRDVFLESALELIDNLERLKN
ncbi:MAG: hypothetical protein JXB60_01400 [Candidatus Cloacimonetes bacterium]|nr:hypothetical protein [Candidatus Cloacimonadota bacterium]